MSFKNISIITVNYNNATGLKKTIESVLQQTSKNFEFIIIDGGSTDESKAIIKQYGDGLDYWVSEPDHGIYHAMNKGIRKATGNYLLFLNSGDCLYDKEVFEKLNVLLNDSYDIYYGDIIYDEITRQSKRTFPDQLNFSFFLEHNLSHQASFIRKNLFDQYFYYDEDFKIVSDWAFFIYVICKQNASYKHLDLVITTYDATGLSSDLSNHKVMHTERAKVIERDFPLFIQDYQTLSLLKSKRTLQFLYIKKHKIAWQILKILMRLILIFLPKTKK